MLLEEIVSANGEWKAAIRRRPDALFEVILFHWTAHRFPPGSDVRPWWNERPDYSLTDTLDGARSIARSILDARDPPTHEG
jgi:hypothetical protein